MGKFIPQKCQHYYGSNITGGRRATGRGLIPTNGCKAMWPVLPQRQGQGGGGPQRRKHLTPPGRAREGIKQKWISELDLDNGIRTCCMEKGRRSFQKHGTACVKAKTCERTRWIWGIKSGLVWLKWRLLEREIAETRLRINREGLKGHTKKSVLGGHYLCVLKDDILANGWRVGWTKKG